MIILLFLLGLVRALKDIIDVRMCWLVLMPAQPGLYYYCYSLWTISQGDGSTEVSERRGGKV